MRAHRVVRVGLSFLVLVVVGSVLSVRAEEEKAAPAAAPEFRVEDFEGDEPLARLRPEHCTAKVVDAPGGGRSLRWTVTPRPDMSWLSFRNVPPDVSRFRRLRFRQRLAEGAPATVYLRLCCQDGSTIGEILPTPTAEWTTVDVLLPEMLVRDAFDPTTVGLLRFVCFDSASFALEIDDIVLLAEGAGWRYSPEERRKMGIDPTAPRFCVADFERDDYERSVQVSDSEITRIEVKRRRKPSGHALRWTVPETGRRAGLTFIRVPGDIREYRVLRFRVRADRKIEGSLGIALQCMKGFLTHDISGLGRKWTRIELPLPDMTRDPKFDPEDVRVLRLYFHEAHRCQLDLDDLELVKGAGGWKRQGKEQLIHVFGKKRVRKVTEKTTDHFRILTDSAAARRKFPRALERIYEFVCRELALPGLDELLPVYIFQNSKLYHDFCVRQGWTRARATNTAGHAGAAYFATYYQAPESAIVAHELTHSIVNRTLGTGGGSWLQEGFAVYVEERWQKRNPAETFAPRLRGGEFVPLAEFLVIPGLAHTDDVRGGARSSAALYLQAGAFFEFLLRGPPATTHPKAIPALALLSAGGPSFIAEVEGVLGATVADIEKAWVTWGSDPPEARPARR